MSRLPVILLLGFAVSWFAFVAWLGAPVTYSQLSDTTSSPATTTGASASTSAATSTAATNINTTPPYPAPLDKNEYDQRLLEMVHYTPPATTSTSTASSSSTLAQPLVYAEDTNVQLPDRRWPAAAPYPNGGAILPFERIVAYYGNFYSTRMGILGEFAEAEVLEHLASTTATWEAADPDTPVRPAIHYIATVAQSDAGSAGLWRNVMPDAHIEQAYDMAKKIDRGILFLDLQVGLSTLEQDLPLFREYFTRPEVHLGIDPEFSMTRGNPPGTVIGTFDAADINFAIEWLSDIVREHELPPKVLVVHRFTQNMVTNYQDIQPTPEVQVVMHMDGWGPVELKKGTYRHFIEPEPVQFTGLKIFYKNDLKPPSTGLFSPTAALQLDPKPLYIQYQ